MDERQQPMAVRLDRLERAAADLPNIRAELRSFTRELEAFEKLMQAHVAAIGHGDTPVMLDASAIGAIASHLADEARHQQRRRSIYRVIGAGTGQLFDLALRIVTALILAAVVARMGGIPLPGP